MHMMINYVDSGDTFVICISKMYTYVQLAISLLNLRQQVFILEAMLNMIPLIISFSLGNSYRINIIVISLVKTQRKSGG